MAEGARAHGRLTRMQLRPGDEPTLEAHLTAWHRTAGRALPGTRLHLLLEDTSDEGNAFELHLFDSPAAFRRAAESDAHKEWSTSLESMLASPPVPADVAVRWNAAIGARPTVSVSIDRDVHASVQDLIARLLARHPRTTAEDLYLTMLQSIAADYERDYPTTMPEEGDPR
ncbi:MAG: hypothetical protein HYX51_02710 [Chloroflexi bacterium]|nr:hypothetical protein [Chloroflexota bacterium]